MNPDLIEVLYLANALSTHTGLSVQVSSLRQCNAWFYTQLLTQLFDIEMSPLSTETARCQAVVDTLSNHLSPQVSLDHIKGAALAMGDLLSIKNLLDIFSVLFCLPPTTQCEEDPANDSNLISTEGFSVISEVLHEELRTVPLTLHTQHSSTTDSNSTTELLRPVPPLPILLTAPATTATPDQPINLQTTPTQSPDRQLRLLMSPLHQSTPHVFTQSRVTQHHTPHALTYDNSPPHTVTEGTVLPADSTHSTAVPDLTITDLHTTPDTTQEAEQSTNSSNQSATVEQAVYSTATGQQTTAAPLLRSDTTQDGSSVDDAGPLDKSRDDVLATLYTNYVSGLRSKVKGRGSRSKKQVTIAVSRKNKRAKAHVYPKQSRVVETPPTSSDSEDEQPADLPTEFAMGDDLLPLVERDFPFLHVSPSMMRMLWQKQVTQIRALTNEGMRSRGRGMHGRVAEIEKKQQALLGLIKKEVQHTQRMQRLSEARSQRHAVVGNVAKRRQNTARAKRYFSDYELELRAKLQRQRTREEQIFKRAFDGGLAQQRERVRELRRVTREQEKAASKQHRDTLDNMENFYRDQFEMLSESMAKERVNTTIREKAQNKLVSGIRRELRGKMENEVQTLQSTLDRGADITHFRELDELTLRHKLASLSFTANVHRT
ncbi:uncharacterized protein LOC135351237 [Halichondria panicea]|uniref:uncharacterized protein LOC135351237 n=1 Tax=Halichondria panicea TaxID=6063 RepID=UPI00312BC754